MSLHPDLASQSVCYLETLGRVSGLPREIEIWFAADPERDRIYLLAGGRDRAQWVRNLRNNPRVQVVIAGQAFGGVASEVEGEADETLARQQVAAKYQGWVGGRGLSAWARDSLPVAIDLTESGTQR